MWKVAIPVFLFCVCQPYNEKKKSVTQRHGIHGFFLADLLLVVCGTLLDMFKE